MHGTWIHLPIKRCCGKRPLGAFGQFRVKDVPERGRTRVAQHQRERHSTSSSEGCPSLIPPEHPGPQPGERHSTSDGNSDSGSPCWSSWSNCEKKPMEIMPTKIMTPLARLARPAADVADKGKLPDARDTAAA